MDERIAEIETKLKQLEVTVRTEIKDIRKLLKSLHKHSQKIEIGDEVQITNNYQGNYGVTGDVEWVTKTQVRLIDQHGTRHTRSKHNVKLICKYE